MTWQWGELARRSGNWLQAGWLIAAALVALYIGVLESHSRYRGISESRETGLAAVSGPSMDPIQLWQSSSLFSFGLGRTASSQSAMEKGGALQASLMGYDGAQSQDRDKETTDRKLIRTAAMDLVVKDPAAATENVRQLAGRLGGFLVSSRVTGAQEAYGAITIRVPVTRFEEARAEIRKLGLRVNADQLEAQDVTRDYVDREARLRNLRAQEQQYLGILKRATSVKDTLEVSGPLNGVRGRIEQEQAEFDALSKQVETVVLTVSLTAEAEAQVFGVHWHPMYRLKMSAREGLDGVGAYLASMAALMFYLPTIILWLATLLIGSAVAWRILRWSARRLFASGKPATTETGSN